MLLHVYQLRRFGARVSREQLAMTPAKVGDLRWPGRGQAVLLDEKGGGLIQPLDVTGWSVRALGLLLVGSQKQFRSSSPKSGYTRHDQSWFCAVQALPLHEWHEAWQMEMAAKQAKAEGWDWPPPG